MTLEILPRAPKYFIGLTSFEYFRRVKESAFLESLQNDQYFISTFIRSSSFGDNITVPRQWLRLAIRAKHNLQSVFKWFNQTEYRVSTPRCREDGGGEKFDINFSTCKILLNSTLYCVPLRPFNASSAFQISLCLLIGRIMIGRIFMFIFYILLFFFTYLPPM